MKWEENDLVLCSIKAVEGTNVTLELEDGTKGNMVFSEVAPGRIRNIREFVVVGKKIVCKILRIQQDRVELSLRRVSAKERELVLEGYKKEKVLQAVLKPVLKDRVQSVLAKIAEKHDLVEFYDSIRQNPDLLKPYISGEELELLRKSLIEKKDKEKEARKKVSIKTLKEDGINEIQEVLQIGNADVHYLGSGTFSVGVKGMDFKQLNARLDKIIIDMQKRAKEKGIVFEVK